MLFFVAVVLLAFGFFVYRSIRRPVEVKGALEVGDKFDYCFDFLYSKLLFDSSKRVVVFVRCNRVISFFRCDTNASVFDSGRPDSVVVPYFEIAGVEFEKVLGEEPAYINLKFSVKPESAGGSGVVDGYKQTISMIDTEFLFEKNKKHRLESVLLSELGLALCESNPIL